MRPQRVPASRYLSAAYAQDEARALWPRVWLHAAALDSLSESGDFVAVTLGGVDVVVIRGADNVLRAFHNVCRHRGRRLVDPPCGRVRALLCPYHAWQWQTDGKLLRIPDREAFGPLPCEDELALSSVACDVWGGQVWVCLGPPEQTLAEWLAPVAAGLEGYDLNDYALIDQLSVELGCNWKLAADAFNESYHLQTVHPYLLGALDDTAIRTEVHGPHALDVIPIGRPSSRRASLRIDEGLANMLRSAGVDPSALAGDATGAPAALARALRANGGWLAALSDDLLLTMRSWFVFPSLTFNVSPDQLMLHRYRPVPGQPERCWLDQFIFQRIPVGSPRPAPPTPRPGRAGRDELGPVLEDDVRNLLAQQRGLHSPAIQWLTVGDREQRIAHLHQMLDRYLLPADGLAAATSAP